MRLVHIILRGCVYSLAGIIALFIMWPSPIAPVSYRPMDDPGFYGVLGVNQLLRQSEFIHLSSGYGPEDVDMDEAGNIYGGLQDGRIVRIDSNGRQTTFANTGGRPLGLDFDKAGNLIVADAFKGLLSIDQNGDMTVLTTGAGDIAFGFTDDLEVGVDGKIYFSDASNRFGQGDYRLDLLEARPHGRLMVYDPADNTTTVLLDKLYFANGIAVSPDGDFVLVNETGRYRVRRYWLKGDQAGTTDIFIDNLPGFPDGISSNGSGLYWLALASPRNSLLDQVHPMPWMKSLIAKLPVWAQPKAIPYGIVIALNQQGDIVGSAHDPSGAVYMVTSAEQRGEWLYLGSLEAPQIVRVKAGLVANQGSLIKQN